jgi:3-oxoadipate enol-lactonase
MPSLGRFRYLEAVPPASASGRKPRTLVLIHAFPLNAAMWEPQLALAERGWRVIAPHLRGMGEGAEGRGALSMDDYVGDLIDLLDGLHLKGSVIGGLSLGGYVTLGLFKHAPSYFGGMVLADTRSPADTPEGVEGRKKMLAVLEKDGVSGVVGQMLPKLISDTTRQRRAGVDEEVRTIAASNTVPGVAGAITAMMGRMDSTALLPSIHCPTLIVVGEDDRLTPPAESQSMHAAIPGSELVILPEAAHLSSFERPDAFNAALGRFLDHHV